MPILSICVVFLCTEHLPLALDSAEIMAVTVGVCMYAGSLKGVGKQCDVRVTEE